MNRRSTTDYAITNLRERAATFGLATVVTLSLLASMDGVADRQYEAAYLAQLSVGTVQMAGAAPRAVGPALLHESV
jgi:hypothetical protein